MAKQEARNQTYAYEQLKGTGLQIPQVHRYISSDLDSVRKGFLMMEYIPGRTVEECMKDQESGVVYETYTNSIYEAANSLSKIVIPALQTPGPVGGGEPCGYLFHEDGFGCRAEFGSIQQMNNWLNERLRLAQDQPSKIHKLIDIHE